MPNKVTGPDDRRKMGQSEDKIDSAHLIGIGSQPPVSNSIRNTLAVAVVAVALAGVATLYYSIGRVNEDSARVRLFEAARIGAGQLTGMSPKQFGIDAPRIDDPLWPDASHGESVYQRWSRTLLADPSVLATAVTDTRGEVLATWPPNVNVEQWLPPIEQRNSASGLLDRTGNPDFPDLLVASTEVLGGSSSTTQLFVHVIANLQLPSTLDTDPLLTMTVMLGLFTAGTIAVSFVLLQQRIIGPLARLAHHLQTHTCSAATGQSNPGRGAMGNELELIASNIHLLGTELENARHRADVLERSIDLVVKRETKQISHKLRHAERDAHQDSLTGLHNRRFMEECFDDLVKNQTALSSDLALIMFDVDNFKPLNDTEGHGAGDDVLRFLGQLLKAALRDVDTGIRYGGDEFAVLLMGVSSMRAHAVAERIVRLFAQGIKTMGIKTPVTLSAGVTALSDWDVPPGPREFLAQADQALYESKRSGKNDVKVAVKQA